MRTIPTPASPSAQRRFHLAPAFRIALAAVLICGLAACTNMGGAQYGAPAVDWVAVLALQDPALLALVLHPQQVLSLTPLLVAHVLHPQLELHVLLLVLVAQLAVQAALSVAELLLNRQWCSAVMARPTP